MGKVYRKSKMSKADWIKFLSASVSITAAQAEKALDALAGKLAEHLAQGESVRIRNVGTFYISPRSAKPARNLHTGESVVVPAHNTVCFRPFDALTRAANGK